MHFSEYDNALKSQTSMSVAQPHKCSGGSRRVSAVTAARRLHACIVCVCVCVCVVAVVCWSEKTESEQLQIHSAIL